MDGRDSPGLVFRNIDSMASCDSFGNYGLIASDCTRLYNIYENGTANEVSAQYAYDARNEEFFRLATERGALQWSSPHFSNFSEEGLMTVSIPNYDPWTFEYRSVSFASVRLSHRKYDYCMILLHSAVLLIQHFKSSECPITRIHSIYFVHKLHCGPADRLFACYFNW